MLQTSFSVEEHEQLRALIAGQRQAALATLHQGRPAISMVTYAQDPDGNFLLHLSALAQHTSDLLARPELALLICEPDTGARNPQTLQRLSIEGRALLLKRDSAEYEAAKTIYLQRLSQSKITFLLGDFSMFRVVPERARFVAGFGRTYDLDPEQLKPAQ
jgi:Putative heme iron utilization protein